MPIIGPATPPPDAGPPAGTQAEAGSGGAGFGGFKPITPQSIADNPHIRMSMQAALANRLPNPDQRRAIREQAGLTIEQLAAELGVDPATVARWEDGTAMPDGNNLRPYVELLEALDPSQSLASAPSAEGGKL